RLRVELDPVVKGSYGAVDEIRLGLVESDRVAQGRDLVGRVLPAVERAGLEDGIALLGPVLIGEHMVVRQAHDRALVGLAHEAAQGPGGNLEVPERAADPERPIPLLVPGLRRPLENAADVTYVHFILGLLADGLDLGTVVERPALDPDGKYIIVTAPATYTQGD